MTDGTTNLAAYFHATTKKEKAYERYNYAGVALDLAQIEERLAEVRSQSLESVGKGKLWEVLQGLDFKADLKAIGMAFANYVVRGRPR